MKSNDPYQIIASIYDAVLEEQNWGTVLTKILEFINLEMGCIQLVDYATGDFRILAHEGYPDTIYLDPPDIDWVEADLWGKAVTPNPTGDIKVGSRLVDPKQYLKSDFYAAAKTLDFPIHDVLASAVSIGNSALSMVALYQRDNQELVSDFDVKKYSLFHGHLTRALNISYRLSSLRSSFKTTHQLTDALPYAVFGISADKSVVFKNLPADKMLLAGSPVYTRRSRIHATWDKDDERFQYAIHQAIGVNCDIDYDPSVNASSFLVHCESSDRLFSVLIFPVSKTFRPEVTLVTHDGIRAMVCISDPSTVIDPRVRHIASAYLLTKNEEALVSALMKGASLSEIAKQTGRSVETLRSQLKSVFGKTNRRSQADLGRLILTAPPMP